MDTVVMPSEAVSGSRKVEEKSRLSDLGRLIFLDRYAKKEHDRTKLSPGQLVVACTDLDTKQRELATVEGVGNGNVDVLVEADGRRLTLPVEHVDLPVEDVNGAHERVAGAIAKAEKPELQTEWAEKFYGILQPFDFVPAGRVWAGAGVEANLTPYNCYVLPPPSDSRSGIVQTLDRMTEIMSRGGGVGIPLLSLRPKFSLVRGVNGRSSGSVCWSEIYSFATGLIEQGGSRRGALMLIQYVWHPDILEFINAKRDAKRLNNANISVGVTDAFMQAVADDANWDLIFPATDHPAYGAEWDGNIAMWKAKGYPVTVYKTMKARDLWNMITEAAHASAEPGLLFVDRYNAMSNSYYYDRGAIFACNPCGEQGIPAWAVCNLGHINLSKFLKGDGTDFVGAEFDFARLKHTVRTAVRFMDNVIDVAYAPFEQNLEQQRLERRVGLGTMGLGEVLIRSHIRYGNNKKCLNFLNEVYGTIAKEAYLASADLAEEKGSFGAFDADKYLSSGFMVTMPQEVHVAVRKKGARNVTLLTQAPTGTVGTMMNTSTGIEPFPWWEWERKGRLGTHRECAGAYGDYLKARPDIREKRSALSKTEQFTTSKHLPDWFVTAGELSPEDHAYTQAGIQRWVDSSISKTSNLPADYTPEQVGRYYQLLHKLGCKGGTVYRDQSRDEQVLNVPKDALADVPAMFKLAAAPRPELRTVPEAGYDLKGVCVQSPLGKLSAKVGVHPEDSQPFEVWLDISRAGTTLNADREAIARLISLVLRLDSSIEPKRRLELVIQQLEGIGGGDSVGFGPNRILSVPDGIAKALSKLHDMLEQPAAKSVVAADSTISDTAILPVPGVFAGKLNGTNGHHKNGKKLLDICPSCHQNTLLRSEGCQNCASCGYSKC